MSPAKLAANQNNAKLSTGPRTGEGKQRSSSNAMRHGLTSKAVLLPWENREEYDALHQSFLDDYQPVSELEHELLRAMVDCWWRLQRARRVETEFLIHREREISESGGASGDTALVLLFTDDAESRKMRLMMRYVDAAERAWRKAQSDWEKARRDAARRSLEEAAQELTAPLGGFVSQTAFEATAQPAPIPATAPAISPRTAAGSAAADLPGHGATASAA